LDYKKLAEEFMQKMYVLNKARPQRKLHDSMQGESFVLHYILHHEDSVLPSEICKIMGISSARIAAALNGLESKGVITRRIDTSDRRRILVDLTPKGKAMAEEQRQEMLENTSKMLSFLGEDDAKEYVRLTGKLAEYITTHKFPE
jgi:DNA-binding MarR family transcriptional regulator